MNELIEKLEIKIEKLEAEIKLYTEPVSEEEIKQRAKADHCRERGFTYANGETSEEEAWIRGAKWMQQRQAPDKWISVEEIGGILKDELGIYISIEDFPDYEKLSHEKGKSLVMNLIKIAAQAIHKLVYGDSPPQNK